MGTNPRRPRLRTKSSRQGPGPVPQFYPLVGRISPFWSARNRVQISAPSLSTAPDSARRWKTSMSAREIRVTARFVRAGISPASTRSRSRRGDRSSSSAASPSVTSSVGPIRPSQSTTSLCRQQTVQPQGKDLRSQGRGGSLVSVRPVLLPVSVPVAVDLNPPWVRPGHADPAAAEKLRLGSPARNGDGEACGNAETAALMSALHSSGGPGAANGEGCSRGAATT
jgi:hypothetical protein